MYKKINYIMIVTEFKLADHRAVSATFGENSILDGVVRYQNLVFTPEKCRNGCSWSRRFQKIKNY